jgi:hypothetical protein
VTRRPILGVTVAALTLASPSHADTNGWNSNVEDNVQTLEQFRAKWNNLLDKAKGQPTDHYCNQGMCSWEWQLRPRVRVKMLESNDRSGQAFYCFLAEPRTTWDCYGNTLQKWVWTPPYTGGGAQVGASDGGASAYAPADQNVGGASAPVDQPAPSGSFSVPLVAEDGGFKTPVGLGSSFFSMTVDTGATSGLVTESVATILLNRGDATEIEGGASTIADGTTMQQRRIVVRNVTLNGHTVHNVMFGVGPDTGGMLFGLLPLAQFGRFTIDAQNGQMVFN